MTLKIKHFNIYYYYWYIFLNTCFWCHLESYMYHLRVYVYQARNLLPMDKDSFSGKMMFTTCYSLLHTKALFIWLIWPLSHSTCGNHLHLVFATDPYCHVSFLHVSQTTEIIKANLNPTWDQTLIFNTIEIYGDPQTVAENPPSVALELFDSDQVVRMCSDLDVFITSIQIDGVWWYLCALQGKDEPMGRCTCPPVVKLNPSSPVNTKLLWFPVTMKGRNAGQMLVAAELLLKDKVCRNCSITPFVYCCNDEALYHVYI